MGETPNSQIAIFDSKPAPLIFEHRNLPAQKGGTAMDHYRGVRAGMVIECEGGYYAGGWIYDNNGNKIKQFKLDGGRKHQANFIKAVRSRKITDLNADILEGHLSTVITLIANISYRVGSAMPPEKITKSLKDNKLAAEMFKNLQAHLAANKIDMNKSQAILGPWLKFDPTTKRFAIKDRTTNLLANSLLTRNYRKPYVVPDQV
jgi:hypothetical protein